MTNQIVIETLQFGGFMVSNVFDVSFIIKSRTLSNSWLKSSADLESHTTFNRFNLMCLLTVQFAKLEILCRVSIQLLSTSLSSRAFSSEDSMCCLLVAVLRFMISQRKWSGCQISDVIQNLTQRQCDSNCIITSNLYSDSFLQ